MRLRWKRLICVALLTGCFGYRPRAQESALSGAEPPVNELLRRFNSPPNDARPMMRWWWFGPAVEKAELQREILAMKAGGIGGFEIQPVYPMALDSESRHFHNLPYLSPEFLDAVKFAADTAHDNGMRVDMTLASGWPYGGPHVSVEHSAARLRVVETDLPAGSTSVPVPALSHGETLIAVFYGEGSAGKVDPAKLVRLDRRATEGRIALDTAPGARLAMFFIESRTGQQVKRAALNAEGFVLDHFSKAAVADHLQKVGEPLLKAFGDTPPYAVFSDSLEVYSADWTDDLLAEFAKRRGYDLTPYLPELVAGNDATSGSVRHDWGVTLTELVNERYLTPVNEWATAHGTKFRSQTYGDPAVSLSSNRLVALPEGEGPQWNTFSFTRWASSASHLYGRPVTSAETWTWLHSPAFRATPLDMKAEADRFFLLGVNQLIGHGWPYTPLVTAEPGWSFYAAAVFNDHNPWWAVMPDVTRYLQRVSFLLRQGMPANDVAVLLPNDDAYAHFVPGKVSLSDEMRKLISPALMQGILGAGYNVDYIDAEAITRTGIPYPVLVLPKVERLSPEVLTAISHYMDGGGVVVCVGHMPNMAPGLDRGGVIGMQVKKLADQIAAKQKVFRMAGEDVDAGSAIASIFAPDVTFTKGQRELGFIHRKLRGADLYFVANTSNEAIDTVVHLRKKRAFVSLWNAFEGGAENVSSGPLTLHLAPYESRVIVSSDGAFEGRQGASKPASPVMIADLTRGWQVRFPGLGEDAAADNTFDAPMSWTEDARTRFYSGTAVYSKTITLSADQVSAGQHIALDFGEGTPVVVDPNIKSGMRALLESPIRETAVVFVNGERVGSVWHPPYVMDLTSALHAGDNRLEIRVANTAINTLAGRASADYRLLWARYGQRFIPQDMEHLEPLPSGLVSRIRLMSDR